MTHQYRLIHEIECIVNAATAEAAKERALDRGMSEAEDRSIRREELLFIEEIAEPVDLYTIDWSEEQRTKYLAAKRQWEKRDREHTQRHKEEMI